MRRHRAVTLRRPWAAVLAILMPVALVGAAVVPASNASWVDEEFVSTGIDALDCTDAGIVDSTAWGRFLTGTVSGQSLESVAVIDGIVVSNTAPATTSSAVSAAGVIDLGSDAWSTTLGLAALPGQPVGGGVTLPFGPANAGGYTQYGRATSAGLSIGAAGAVTSAAGGVVMLETPGSATPRLAALTLSTLLDPVLAGGGLGTTVAQLADVQLHLGAVGAVARYDSCPVLWNQATAPGAALVREYLVDDLGLGFTSTRVTELAASIRSSLTSLESTLDAITGPGGTAVTGAALTAVQGTLSSALNLNIAGIGIGLGTIDSLTVAANFDLAPARNLVTGTLSDGVVSIDLGTGRITADLDALFGQAYGSSTGLNGLGPNTAVLTPAVLGALSARVGTVLTSFVTTTIANAVTSAINNTVVTVALGAHLNAIVPNALILQSTFTGTVGGFTGVSGHAAPVANTTVSVVPGLGFLGSTSATLNAVIGPLTSGIASAIATSVLPSIGTNVVTPLKATATTAASGTITTITGTTIPAFLGQLGGILTTLGTLVDVTVNARPDQPNPVGSPAAAAPGRYFETALHVGVVNAIAATIGTLYFASASVGPNALR